MQIFGADGVSLVDDMEEYGAGAFDALSSISWYSSFWAEDPDWVAPSNGVAVDSWRNAGSLGTAATSTGANRPTYSSSVAALNSKPAINFLSTNSQRLNITSGPSLTNDFSIVVIGTLNAFASAPAFVGLSAANNGRRFGLNTGGNLVANMGAILTGGSVLSTGTPYLASAYFNNTSSSVYLNNVSDGTGAAGAADVDQIIIGAGLTSPSTYSSHLNGTIAFLGIIAGNVHQHSRWSDFVTWSARYNVAV